MRLQTTVASAGILVLALTACSSGGDSSADGDSTVTVAYQTTSSFYQLDDLLQKAKTEYEEANPGTTIELVPIEADEDQYYTKLALMNGSADTAPDVIYEDTFQIRSDAAAGYLLPIDDYLAEWDDWDQFLDTAKEAGLGDDGLTYGVPMGTDTRAIYYNKDLFEQAGLPTDWQPTSWDDILEAARTIQAALPDVTPLNVYAGKANGEATTMQGVEMLLYGTGDELYDSDSEKWYTGSQGMIDSLTFLDTIYSEDLAPSLDIALDSSVGTKVSTEMLPEGSLAIAVDGSWLPGSWISGDNAWDGWEDTIGIAAMPTEDGQDPGYTSMSGGWTLSVGANSEDPQAAFDFISLALNQENSLKYDTENSQIAVRSDVAEDQEYLDYNPTFEFFSSLVQYTHFRPATPDYSQISSQIQVAAESVASGQATPEEAAATYDEGLISIVGEEATEAAD
ncbi:MAG TPA: extracellular solute-binding protein [Cellulomonas sp.]